MQEGCDETTQSIINEASTCYVAPHAPRLQHVARFCVPGCLSRVGICVACLFCTTSDRWDKQRPVGIIAEYIINPQSTIRAAWQHQHPRYANDNRRPH